MSTELIEAAETYLSLGLSIIALTVKRPNGSIHPHWLQDAIALNGNGVDTIMVRARVEASFNHPDTTGIGIVIQYPYFVVDIDGEEGAENWKKLVGEDQWLPDRWVAMTGRGLHLWYSSTEPVANGKLAEKLDIKGQGGYVAAPPSRHFNDDGVQDALYRWLVEPGLDAPMELPPRLEAVFEARRFDRERAMESKAVIKAHRNVYVPGSGLFAPNTTSFDGIIDRVKAEGVGNRNNLLYWAARSLIDEGAGAEDIEELLDAAIESGVARSEARRTIRSAVDAGR